MPGMFGAVGCTPSCWDTLLTEFSTIWGEVEACQMTMGAVGGHAFGGTQALHELPGGLAFVIDGEASVYPLAGKQARDLGAPLFRIGRYGLRLAEDCAGNVAVLDSASGSLFLAAAVSGSFPLYYAEVPGGVLFSSLLRPLIRAMACIVAVEPDMVGVVQWLRRGCYFLGNRTFYSGAQRLLPGQVLRFQPEVGSIAVEETSDICAGGYDSRVQALDDAADVCWEGLVEAARRSAAQQQRMALMMSAGWDSRVLLAALRAAFGSEKVLCYSHGDLASRELHLVRRICEETTVRFRLESPEAAYDLGAFDEAFPRVESLVFPEWQHAGRVLADMGIRSVSAGIYGEIIGGDQGPDDLERGYRKIPVLVKELAVGTVYGGRHQGLDVGRLRSAFFVRRLSKPWYLLPSAWEAMPPACEGINADLESDLRRLTARGIEYQDQLLEAFSLQSRQTQYTIGQLLSCRASVDISTPFGDHRLLRLASRIPWTVKYRRTLMRCILQRHAADLLNLPMAATLVPARFPMAAQEVSRLVRRLDERARWRLHHVTFGVVSYPRYGWWWYEFLKDGSLMHALVDDLRCDFWDRAAIHDRISGQTGTGARLDARSPTADVLGHVLRISTVDRLLR